MSRARRRRSRSAPRRSWTARILVAVAVVAVGVVVVGSLVEVHAQSSGYRSTTDHGFGVLAARVVDASNQTGRRLADVVSHAPALTDDVTGYSVSGGATTTTTTTTTTASTTAPPTTATSTTTSTTLAGTTTTGTTVPGTTVPGTAVPATTTTVPATTTTTTAPPTTVTGGSARAVLEQGLDEAVAAAQAEAASARAIVPPAPDDGAGDRLVAIMDSRATATAALRHSIDAMLGLTPLSEAGASTATPAGQGTGPSDDGSGLVPVAATATALAAVGQRFERGDAAYRALRADFRHLRPTVALPSSTWVPAPVTDAPLGTVQLGASAAAIGGTAALVPDHQVVISSLGLSPPAVSTGGVGTFGAGCAGPGSLAPGPAPTVLPPTSTLAVAVSVTNCGNVSEPHLVLTQTLTLADPPGTAPPPAAGRGDRSTAVLRLAPGTSAVPGLRSLRVAPGHTYALSVTLAPPAGQASTAGTTEQLVVHITG